MDVNEDSNTTKNQTKNNITKNRRKNEVQKNLVRGDVKTKNSNRDYNKKNSNFLTNLNIFSYNSRGFDKIKQSFCQELIHREDPNCSIICNQENFILKGNEHLIQQSLPEHHLSFKQAKKDHFNGRPDNGMFIAIPAKLKPYVTDVSPINQRIQALIIRATAYRILLLNVYFPTDCKTFNGTIDDKLENILVETKNIIQVHNCETVLLAGDFNYDPSRNNDRVRRMETFLEELLLKSCWSKFDVDFTHEHIINGRSYTSTLDHFLYNQKLSNAITNVCTIHHPSNTSDHCPILCQINVDIKCESNRSEKRQSGKNTNNTINTKLLDENDWCKYQLDLNSQLSNIVIPNCINCNDCTCKHSNHIIEIDRYVRDILNSVESCIKGIGLLKRSTEKSAKVVPGWTDIVKPLFDQARFWNSIWISAGRPINTELHSIMKRTRNKYHYALRKCKRAREKILKEKLLTSCLNGKENIFDKLKKLRYVNSSCPERIDGFDDPAHRFQCVYKNLYNSADDREETTKLMQEINSSIDDSSLKAVELVTPNLIEKLSKQVKANKRDPQFMFNSDCIKHGGSKLYLHISNMIRLFLIHGHVSDTLLVATIVPLIKDKLGNAECSDNYRSIAISSVILKIFDWVILDLFGDKLELDELQFSYQPNVSTTMCTWLMVESIEHFRRNDNNIFACSMDMRKAFDMVRHSLLFKKLMSRNIPLIFLRLMLYMYLKQTAQVKWNGKLSEKFTIQNGVKQGAVLSAVLFCLYIDGLIKKLRKKREGCWFKNSYVGIIVYADDIVLLSPSIDGLQRMINDCFHYAHEHNLEFSTHILAQKSKTKCIAFLVNKRTLPILKLNEKDLPWVNTVKHLGTTITNTSASILNQDILEKRAQYIAKNNQLLQEFFFADPTTKVLLNNIFNTSFYGSPLWDHSSSEFTKFEKTWNVSMRLMLSLPRDTHRYFLEPLSETLHMTSSLRKRFLTFKERLKESQKRILRKVLREVEYNTCSTTGRNTRRFIRQDIRKPYNMVPDGKSWQILIAHDLISSRSNNDGFLSTQQLNEILNFICAS